jgi:hypothetical protein
MSVPVALVIGVIIGVLDVLESSSRRMNPSKSKFSSQRF